MKIGHVLKKIDLMMKKWGLNVYINQVIILI
jgi:hypothetical protein